MTKIDTACTERGSGGCHENGIVEVSGINVAGKDVSRTIRAVYGKCGFDSVFRPTGQGITGIVEVY